MINLKRWGDIRNAFDDWSFEDVYTLHKAIELKQVDTYWELGFKHVARLQMLAKQFRYDELLQKIYNHMMLRVNEKIKYMNDNNIEMHADDIEMLFKGQPFLYNEDVRVGNLKTVLYDVKKCVYKKRLQRKYSKQYDLIQDMVMI